MEAAAIQRQHETTRSYLELLHESWSPVYKRVLRSAGLDAQLNEEFRPLREGMDTLLDDYFRQSQGLQGEL